MCRRAPSDTRDKAPGNIPSVETETFASNEASRQQLMITMLLIHPAFRAVNASSTISIYNYLPFKQYGLQWRTSYPEGKNQPGPPVVSIIHRLDNEFDDPRLAKTLLCRGLVLAFAY